MPLAIGASLAACHDTTGAGDQTFVAISAPSPVVLRGDQIELSATVWSRTSPGDSVEIRNAELVWSSADPTLATITTRDVRTAVATGVNPGVVQIEAVASGFEGAGPAVFALRVSNPLEIDSMRPSVVRYGEKLTMYGVGVSNLFFAGLEGATLFPDTFSVATGGGGVGEISFWVPPPASSGQVVVLSPGQLVIAPDATTVVPEDLHEPNETAPSAIDLDAPPPFPAVPMVRYFNPALAFEDLIRGDTVGLDWYRFSSATPGIDLTFVFNAPTFSGAHRTYLSSPTSNGADLGASAWTIGSGLYHCKGHPFEVSEQPADSLIVALRNLAPGSIDLISRYFVPGRYGLAVVEGYRTSDPSIGPDRMEENDNCEFADRNFADPATHIDLTTPYADTLTVDNPHDIDWIRFRVPGPGPQQITVRSAARPGAGAVDESDIDLYLLAVPGGGSLLDPQGDSRTPGSDESVTAVLAPGDYYLVVADYAGVPTRYSLCAAAGSACVLPGVPAAGVRRAPARRPPGWRGR